MATQRRERARTALILGQLIHPLTDRTALRRAHATDVVASAIVAFPGDAIVAQVGLGALYHVWIPPVNTHCLIQLVLDEMARYQRRLLIQQAGLRLLRMHAASEHQLLLAPTVLSAVVRAMRAHQDDDTVQHWGAETVCCLASIDPADVSATHGASECAAMAQLTQEIASSGPRTLTLVMDGQPWYEIIRRLSPDSAVEGRTIGESPRSPEGAHGCTRENTPNRSVPAPSSGPG